MSNPKDLLPWYLNDSLPEEERARVEAWRARDPESEAAARRVVRVATAVAAQPTRQPSRLVAQKLMAQIGPAERSRVGFGRWAWGLPVVLLIFGLLWALIQPGNQVRWTVGAGEMVAFRVYRAASANEAFELLAEIPATAGQKNYRYADLLIVPGKTYHYVIETVDQHGYTTLSPALSSNTLPAFAVQLTVLLTSVMLAFGMMMVLNETKAIPRAWNLA